MVSDGTPMGHSLSHSAAHSYGTMGIPRVCHGAPWTPMGHSLGHSAAHVLLWDNGYPASLSWSCSGSLTRLLRDFLGIMVLAWNYMAEIQVSLPRDWHGDSVRILRDIDGNLS